MNVSRQKHQKTRAKKEEARPTARHRELDRQLKDRKEL